MCKEYCIWPMDVAIFFQCNKNLCEMKIGEKGQFEICTSNGQRPPPKKTTPPPTEFPAIGNRIHRIIRAMPYHA